MAKRRMSGTFKISVNRLNESTGLYENGVSVVTGFMYQIGAYQYFLHWDKIFQRLDITESSTGFRVKSVEKWEGETSKQCHDRAIEEMKGFNPSLGNWEKAKSMMKKARIPYPLNEWITNLKDINSNEEGKENKSE